VAHTPVGASGHPPSTVSLMECSAPARPGFAVVDLETTGFSPEQERVIEVAVVVLDPDGREVDAFCTLVDPECGPGPTHVHGITAEMLEGAPTFAGIHPYLAGLLSGRVVVGHNVDRFDLAFLLAECRRLGGEALVPASVTTLDTLRVAQAYLDLPGKARLVDCCDRYRLTWDDHHSALGDARVTAALFGAMRAELGDDMIRVDRLLVEGTGPAWPGWSDVRPVAHERRHTSAA
jgi:DNA polymerase III subunit epsilon